MFLTRSVVADCLWYRIHKAKLDLLQVNTTKRIRLGVTNELICAANRQEFFLFVNDGCNTVLFGVRTAMNEGTL